MFFLSLFTNSVRLNKLLIFESSIDNYFKSKHFFSSNMISFFFFFLPDLQLLLEVEYTLKSIFKTATYGYRFILHTRIDIKERV